MITVTFKKDYELSPDGINTRNYEKGKSYTAQHTHEDNIFRNAVASGIAENAQKIGRKQVKNKVNTPSKRKTTKE